MQFLVYRSRALVAPGSAEAARILAASVRNNARGRLTGFVHHEPQLFVQYLEGPADELGETWSRIRSDPRHADATAIGRGPLSHRLFGGWRMGCSDAGVARFSDFLGEAAGKSRADEATARELIWFLRGACQLQDLGLAG